MRGGSGLDGANGAVGGGLGGACASASRSPIQTIPIPACAAVGAGATGLVLHHHQPINVPTARAQAFLMDYT
jgi:hypothetical protein